MKKIHPDLFQDSDYERSINAESLKILNGYMDVLSKGMSPKAARIEFFIKDTELGGGSAMKKVMAQLSGGRSITLTSCNSHPHRETLVPSHVGNGNLAPLFFAFGLIDEAQLQQESMFGGSVSDTNFLAYLREQVGEAVRTAERHDMLRLNIRKLRSGLEEKYQLSSVQVIFTMTGCWILELRLQLCPIEPHPLTTVTLSRLAPSMQPPSANRSDRWSPSKCWSRRCLNSATRGGLTSREPAFSFTIQR